MITTVQTISIPTCLSDGHIYLMKESMIKFDWTLLPVY